MTTAQRFLQLDMGLDPEIEILQVGGTSSEDDSRGISDVMFLLGTSDIPRTTFASATPFTNARNIVGDSSGSMPVYAHSSTPVTYARTTVGDSAGSTQSPRSSSAPVTNVRMAVRDSTRPTGGAVASTVPLFNARMTTIRESTRPITTRVGTTSTATFTTARVNVEGSTRSIPVADNRTSAGGPTRPTLRINRRTRNATSQTRSGFQNQGSFFSGNRASIRSDNRTSAEGPTATRPFLRMNRRSQNGTSQTRNVFLNELRYFSELRRTRDFAIELEILCSRLQSKLMNLRRNLFDLERDQLDLLREMGTDSV